MTSTRLHRLVRLRKLVEDVKARELDERRTALVRAEARLDETRQEIVGLDRLAARPSGSVHELLMVAGYQGHLEKQAASQTVVVSEREASVEEGRVVVRDAWQERRLMENLHLRAVETEAEETDRAERRTIDALALTGFIRRGRGA